MSLITKSRLVSLVSASAFIGTMAVAAAARLCHGGLPVAPTGFLRDGKDLTAAQIRGTVTGELNATATTSPSFSPTRSPTPTSPAPSTSASSSTAARST